MQVERHRSAESFLQASSMLLMRDEAENNLLVGLAHGLVRQPSLAEGAYLATVMDQGQVGACAIHLAPYKLVLTRGRPAAVDALARDLFAIHPELDGVSGPEPSSGQFAAAWGAMTGVPPRAGAKLRIYQARTVRDEEGPSGFLRPAGEPDLGLLTSWIDALSREAGFEQRPDAARVAGDGIRNGRLHVWDDGGPVAMAGWAGKTPRGVRLNLIYAPPRDGARAYRIACVVALTHRLLDQGAEFCWLYTDQSDPAAARDYERIGYRAVADLTDYTLSAKRPGET